MTYKNIILTSIFALFGIYLSIAAETAEMANLTRSISSQSEKTISVPVFLITKITPLIRKMLLGDSKDSPQKYAQEIISAVLVTIKNGTISNETKNLLESIVGILKRCSESKTLIYGWPELKGDKFKSILPQSLLDEIDSKFKVISFSSRL